MNRVATIIFLCLLASAAHATFEIQDPANQIIDELDKEQAEKADQQRDAAEYSAMLPTYQAGNTTCSAFVTFKELNSRHYQESLDWMQGFIQGARYRQAGPEGVPEHSVNLDSSAVSAWTVGYCLEYPQNELIQAAGVFIEEYSVTN